MESSFKPSYTPIQMFQMGIFGGKYFEVETTLPEQFLIDLKAIGYVDKEKRNSIHNHYKVTCGTSLQSWLDSGVIHKDDPNGWVEWYIKYYYGRRHEDDARQIKRFKAFISRHTGMLKNYPNSIKTKQNLLQWAWNYEDKF